MMWTPVVLAALLWAAPVEASVAPAHVEAGGMQDTTFSSLAVHEPARVAAFFAERFQAMVGTVFQDGIVLSAVASEGGVLIFTLGGPENWRQGRTPETISTELLAGFCETAATFFESGVRLRVDSVEPGGAPWRGPVADRCPSTGAPAS